MECIDPRPVQVTVWICDRYPALALKRDGNCCSASYSAIQALGGPTPITRYKDLVRPAPSWCPAGTA